MSTIVGHNYMYYSCSTCLHNETEKVYGMDSHEMRQHLDKLARQKGWYISSTSDRTICPECLQKEREESK